VLNFDDCEQIPAYPNAPLLPPPETNSKSDDSSETLANRANNARWPLVLFSHGLAGTRTTYSQWCGNLASEGHVVLALEHRDGSGPIVFVRSETEGRTIERVYVPYGDVTFVTLAIFEARYHSDWSRIAGRTTTNRSPHRNTLSEERSFHSVQWRSTKRIES
jgi:hypothetical protein